MNRQLLEFHKAFGHPIARKLTDEEYRLRLKLIGEEWSEFCQEAAGLDLEKPSDGFAKEMADLIYVLVGTAIAMGINIEKAFELVHQSNMSKLSPVTGKPVLRADGKVLKGPNYKAPDLTSCMPTYTNVVKINPCVGHSFTPEQQESGLEQQS